MKKLIILMVLFATPVFAWEIDYRTPLQKTVEQRPLTQPNAMIDYFNQLNIERQARQRQDAIKRDRLLKLEIQREILQMLRKIERNQK